MASQTFFLVLKKSPLRRMMSATISTRAPKAPANAVTLQLDLDIPDALFHRPALRASVKVPDPTGERITATLADDLGKALSRQLGVHVSVSVEGDDNAE